MQSPLKHSDTSITLTIACRNGVFEATGPIEHLPLNARQALDEFLRDCNASPRIGKGSSQRGKGMLVAGIILLFFFVIVGVVILILYFMSSDDENKLNDHSKVAQQDFARAVSMHTGNLRNYFTILITANDYQMFKGGQVMTLRALPGVVTQANQPQAMNLGYQPGQAYQAFPYPNSKAFPVFTPYHPGVPSMIGQIPVWPGPPGQTPSALPGTYEPPPNVGGLSSTQPPDVSLSSPIYQVGTLSLAKGLTGENQAANRAPTTLKNPISK